CVLSVHPLSLNSRWPAVYPILTQWEHGQQCHCLAETGSRMYKVRARRAEEDTRPPSRGRRPEALVPRLPSRGRRPEAAVPPSRLCGWATVRRRPDSRYGRETSPDTKPGLAFPRATSCRPRRRGYLTSASSFFSKTICLFSPARSEEHTSELQSR